MGYLISNKINDLLKNIFIVLNKLYVKQFSFINQMHNQNVNFIKKIQINRLNRAQSYQLNDAISLEFFVFLWFFFYHNYVAENRQ